MTVNNIDLIARAHQLVMEGYKYMFDQKLVTVWSAPNYTYRCGNVASVMKLDQERQPEFVVFDATPEGERKRPLEKPLPYFL